MILQLADVGTKKPLRIRRYSAVEEAALQMLAMAVILPHGKPESVALRSEQMDKLRSGV